MTRVKRGLSAKKRHKKLLKETKGYWGQRGNIFRRAHETHIRALAFAFKGRRLKKRDMRALFIGRIKAALELQGLKYSSFIHGLKLKHIELNRKMLSQLATLDPETFTAVTAVVKQ